MPKGIFKHKLHTEETKVKMRGRTPWNKGKVGIYSEETLNHWSKIRTGVKHTEETKIKIGLKSKGGNSGSFKKGMTSPNKGKHNTKISGSKHYNWKGGISPEDKIIRQSIEYRLWREAVFARDNWTCQKTGVRSGNGKTVYLEAHHIQNFAKYPELRFAIDNGITLSRKVHYKFHSIYNRINNTKEQLKEFLNK